MKNKRLVVVLKILAFVTAVCLFCFVFVDSPYFNGLHDYLLRRGGADETLDRIVVLDVGEADCVLVQSNGRFALIDTGLPDERELIKTLKNYGVTGLDAVILTHWHTDHCGGLDAVCNAFPVAHVITRRAPDDTSDTYDTYRAVRRVIEQRDIPCQTARAGMTVRIGQIELTVLCADGKHADENNCSVVLMARCGSRQMLLMADAEQVIEEELLHNGYRLDCDVLKVGHHGSSSGSSIPFLKAVDPDYAVISVGHDNDYNHPHKAVLDRLANANCNVYRTDYDGNVTVTFGETLKISGEHN